MVRCAGARVWHTGRTDGQVNHDSEEGYEHDAEHLAQRYYRPLSLIPLQGLALVPLIPNYFLPCHERGEVDLSIRFVVYVGE